jgi:hypothetical protein
VRGDDCFTRARAAGENNSLGGHVCSLTRIGMRMEAGGHGKPARSTPRRWRLKPPSRGKGLMRSSRSGMEFHRY